tara:strand:- start:193 stop:474 length:282 start_codon:yes stop_codon:yes gene_type:complete
MGVEEFYNYLPKHFWNKLDGFYELENIREKGQWERARWTTTLLLNIQIAKGKKLKPTDLIEFEWDKKDKKLDYEKLKAKAEYIKKLSEYKNKK